MLDIVLIGLIIGWFVLFYSVRDVFSPWSITLLVWAAVLFAYGHLDHDLYSTSRDFGYGVALWCSSFCTLGYITYRLTPANTSPEWSANYSIVRFFAAVSIIVTPFCLYKAASFAMLSGSENLMNTMRDQVVDQDSGFSLGPVAYLIHVIYAILIVSADEVRRWNKWFFLLCMGINLLFCIIMMSKLTFFIGLVSTLYLFYVHGRIKLRTIGLVALGFVFIGLFLTQVRATTDGDTDSESSLTMLELVLIYLLSPVPAFGLESACSSPVWGYETFRAVYSILEKLGLYHGPLYDLKRMFVWVPIPTNVYTGMSPFYNDFGLPGIAAMGAIEGIIIAYVYKKATTGHTLARNFYAYLTAVLALQYYDDEFFVSGQNVLQMVVFIFICHIKPVWKPGEKFLIGK